MNGQDPSTDTSLLETPDMSTPHAVLDRTPSAYTPHPTYRLPPGSARHYQNQYADMYFARLAQLKPATLAIAADAFDTFSIADETARRVDRVLDVRQGELCWVVGTCYMEMPLKPNVLDDIGKEHWIAAPPTRVKYDHPSVALEAGEGAHGAHAGGTGGVGTQIMLEDESGRLRLTGSFLRGCLLVTGAIVAVVGTENKDGDFEVLDLRVPDLPRQPQRWEADDGNTALTGKKPGSKKKRPRAGKVAIVSGLGISGDEGDTLTLDLLLEYLLGESTSPADQEDASTISRLIIAGNSLSHASPIPSRQDVITAATKNAAKASGTRKYGYDSAAYNAAPTDRLDQWLASLLPSMPITLLPGAQDPTSTSLPQQPIHAAMFPHSRNYMAPPTATTKDGDGEEVGWFDSQTNPADFTLDGFRFLGTGGQPVDDVYKYIAGEERLEMMEAMLRWRLSAPTAPDTLPCYPFQDEDQFVIKDCPHVFFVGNQPRFETTLIEGPVGQAVRIIAVPRFKETGEVVVVDMETLVPEVVRFEVFD
ncbi:hypothetical protein LTR36_002349 [Oleoguttula mirabilis]|uniref:DNA-directed DNA polymerase n=1 Tax=Oleoguttula mirabilis TaxID=1507867 RepID=A0AAV9JLL1_9PEZI|nr:hypothetical protein LTR36_002349 [Oleoguttula mirabilis]